MIGCKGFRSYALALLCIAMGSLLACGGDDAPAVDTEAPARIATSEALARKFADPAVRALIRQETVEPESYLPPDESVSRGGLARLAHPESIPDTPAIPDLAAPIGCGDFDRWQDAQAFFHQEGGPASDSYYLDTDADEIACNAETDQGSDIQMFEGPILEDLLAECGGWIAWRSPSVEDCIDEQSGLSR